jgi:AraC-like DNA-binding protein
MADIVGVPCIEAGNLVSRAGVQVAVSTPLPSGGGASNPHVLLNDSAHRLHGHPLSAFDRTRTYDTFDGWNEASTPDCYTIEFPEPVSFTCIEMTMGFPFRDGGWWTSLGVETRAGTGDDWIPARDLTITPPYTFEDKRGERRPFETYVLSFASVRARSFRLIGRPGGLAQFTSLARVAAYERDLSRWNPLILREPPVPNIFRLIPPRTVWTLSENLARLTGLTIELPMMEYYLDQQRHQQFWQRTACNYHGEPELWFLYGQAIGWTAWNQLNATPMSVGIEHSAVPNVRTLFHDTLASAHAPIVVDDRVLGVMSTSYVILGDTFDWSWHRDWARQHNIPWRAYQAAVRRTLHMSRDQMEGAAALLGTIANTIVNLAHHLDRTQDDTDQRARRRHEIVRRAIDLMEQHLEAPITVAAVARAVNLNAPYFCTLFAEQTGLTPSEYLINLRLARAKEYLEHTTMSVADVCAALGYDPSYFSRLFKRHTGHAPGHYARLMRAR